MHMPPYEIIIAAAIAIAWGAITRPGWRITFARFFLILSAVLFISVFILGNPLDLRNMTPEQAMALPWYWKMLHIIFFAAIGYAGLRGWWRTNVTQFKK